MRFIDERGRLGGRVSLIDVALLLSGLLVISAFTFGYKLVGHQALRIYQIRPARVTTGVNQHFTIIGTGFDLGSVVFLGSLPLQRRVLNEAFIEAILPSEMDQGMQVVSVRNGRGRLVMKENAFEVIWKPEILRIEPKQIKVNHTGKLIVIGRYFDKDCKVFWGRFRLRNVTRVNSGYLEVTAFPHKMIPKLYSLTVANSQERKTTVMNAVEVTPNNEKQGEAPFVQGKIAKLYSLTVANSEVTPNNEKQGEAPFVQEKIAYAAVLCSFSGLDEEKKRCLRPGVVHLGRQEWPTAKVLDVLARVPAIQWWVSPKGSPQMTRSSKGVLMVASLGLEGELKKVGEETTFFFEGKPLTSGSPIHLSLHLPRRTFGNGRGVTGVLLTEPTLLSPTIRDFLGAT